MSSTKPTKSELQEEALKNQRRKSNFLPQYSDYYFEKKKKSRKTAFSISIYFMIIFCILELVFSFKNTAVHNCTVISIFLFIFLLKIYPLILNCKKACGITFGPDIATQTHIFSKDTYIFYSDIENAVAENDIYLADTGLQIGHGSNKLVFHYEIGDSLAQKHIEECYNELQSHIHTKLPPYEKKGLDLLDRRYFYEKSRKNQTLSLLVAILSFFSIVRSSTLTTTFALILALVFCYWECHALYILFKNAVFTAKNNLALEKIYGNYPHARIGKQWTGYLYFGIIVVLVILSNLQILLNL